MSPAKKPDTGPAGKPAEAKPNPPVLERFYSAPEQLYDLEAIAGAVFAGINKENWPLAETELYHLQSVWQETKQAVGDKKGIKEAEEALGKLSASIAGKQITASYVNLNKFMGSIGTIGKSYKLSPISDIITVGNAIRNVSFYAEDKNWTKAASKVKELDDSWSRIKPSLEQFGILGEVTKTHSYVNQLKDAVNAENKGAVDDRVADLNDSMGRIREFYRGK